MKLKKKEKQLPLFWRVFIISVSCALALIIVGASLFALYMSQYENSRPETLISNYIDSLGEDGLAEYIINNFPENTGNFSTVDQVVSEVIMPTLKNSIRYEKRVGEYSDDQPVYTLIAGERKIARISFTPEGKTLFGFNKWGEAELEYEADFSDLHYDALYIKVPGGASVTFEGNRLTSSYIERTEKYSGPSSEYEKPVKLPICEVYNAGEGYGDPNIVVFSGDNQLQVMSASIDEETGIKTISYSFPPSRLHSLTFIVPSDAIVTVNGKTVTSDFITESNLPYPSADKWNADSDSAPYIPSPSADKWNIDSDSAPYRVKYFLDGLVTVGIEFSVSAYDGTVLTPVSSDEESGIYEYEYPSELLRTAEIYAPEGSSVTLNSVELTASELIGNGAVPNEIESIGQLITNPERVCVYRVGGLYSEPKIEITDKSGKKLTITAAENMIYSFDRESSDELMEAHKAYVEQFTDNYIKYYTDGRIYIEENFENLILPYIQPDSEAYKYLSIVFDSLAWREKSTVSEKNISSHDYIRWGDNCFSCNVDFMIKYYNPNSGAYEEENVKDWQLFFVNTTGGENGWKIAKFIFH